MRRVRRLGTPNPGEVVFKCRRYSAALSWSNGSISNLTYDQVDYDPWAMLVGGPGGSDWLARWSGRYDCLGVVCASFGSAAGSLRYARWAVAAGTEYGMQSGFPFLANARLTVPVPMAARYLSAGAVQRIEIFQDSGAAQTISEADICVRYLGGVVL